MDKKSLKRKPKQKPKTDKELTKINLSLMRYLEKKELSPKEVHLILVSTFGTFIATYDFDVRESIRTLWRIVHEWKASPKE